MLNIEIIKFEAQDVITASGFYVEIPACPDGGHNMQFNKLPDGTRVFACSKCGYTGTTPGGNGSVTVKP